HPRTRLVLSQCSEVSVLAAVFHGVPLVCLPSGMDEREPAARVSQLGVGVSLPHVPHEQELLAAVNDIISNSSYRYAARHLGVMIRDEPETSADRLVFWAGHAARHWGHGHEDAMLSARLAPRDEPLGHLNTGLILGFVCGLVSAACVIFAKRIVSQGKAASSSRQSKEKNK
ncbi:UDP-glycosyltransferase-22, partial [Ephemera danica]